MAVPPVATTEAATEVTSTEAMLHGTVNPKGLKTTYYFEYGTTAEYGVKTVELSAGSGTKDIKENAVIENLVASTTYHFRIVATNSSGTTKGSDETFTTPAPSWSIRELPFSEEEGQGQLHGVSCPSLEFCVAVGTFEKGGNLRAIHLNGEEWTVQPLSASGFLSGVSCTSSTACIAVGSQSTGTLAASWNGSEWKTLTTPNPSGAAASHLLAVSCTSSTQCTAVGWYEKEGKRYTLAERWNGTEWTIQTTLSPGEGLATALMGVSCTSSTVCTAAGFHWKLNSGKVEIEPMAQRWNGTEWALQTVPKPVKEKATTLHAISCTASNACTATGRYENPGYITLAERWNGTAWAVQTTPNPAGQSILYGVSCSSSTACMAAGVNYLANEQLATIAEGWNGTEWTLQTTPNVAGADESLLNDVSCPFPTRCVAVGYWREERAIGPGIPLVEFYE